MSEFKQYTASDGVSVSTSRKLDFTDALEPIPVEVPSATATDVLRDIDQLRRDLSGYHGQLKAHNDLQRHCDNQRERISELEGLYAGAKADIAEAKAENEKLRELVRGLAYATHPADRAELIADAMGLLLGEDE